MKIQQILIDSDFIGRRLDKFLRDKFQLKQSLICNFCRKGFIKINNKKIDHKVILQKDDVIFISESIILNQKIEKITNNNLPEEMIHKLKKAIIFEDEKFLVINKPFGLAVQSGENLRYCLEDFFPFLCEKQLRIVHRLDKSTSGIILLAKSLNIAQKISEMFKNKEIEKKYWAIVDGIPEKNEGLIESRILNNEDSSESLAINLPYYSKKGKEAKTIYKILQIDKERNLALLEMSPITGRKHQLRLHARQIGCPILGDEKYGNPTKITKKLQLFAYYINANPFFKIELTKSDFSAMIKIETFYEV